jgi:hypothetical protein
MDLPHNSGKSTVLQIHSYYKQQPHLIYFCAISYRLCHSSTLKHLNLECEHTEYSVCSRQIKRTNIHSYTCGVLLLNSKPWQKAAGQFPVHSLMQHSNMNLQNAHLMQSNNPQHNSHLSHCTQPVLPVLCCRLQHQKHSLQHSNFLPTI